MPKHSDPLTQRAQQVLTVAHDEAIRLNHNYIGTEHLLLGLLHEYKSLATQILIAEGLDLQHTREQVLTIIQQGDRQVSEEIDFTPRAQEVLKRARETAQRLGHEEIGTEHLLLGLLQVEDGVAASVLNAQGVNATALYNDVLLHLDHEHVNTLPQQVVPVGIGALVLAGAGTATAILLRKKRNKQ